MLNKFLNVHKLAPFCRRIPTKPPSKPPPETDGPSSALKIVHAGGNVECYYMAIPALKIMEKYPSFVLARPQVFKQPWESVVRSNEILTLGEKFYLVPRRTVRKLQRRIKKPSNGEAPIDSFVSQSSVDVSSGKKKMFLQKGGSMSDSSGSSFGGTSWKKSGKKKHVRFIGIDVKHKGSSSPAAEKKGKEDNAKKSLNSKEGGKRRMPPSIAAWQPSLTSITESQGD